MTVAELQKLLSDLGRFLRMSEAAKIAGELEYITAKLDAFKGYKLRAFADFLEQAEQYSRGALAPKPAKGRKGKGDSAAVEEASQRLLHLYAQAIDPSVTLEQIEAAVQAMTDLDPPRTVLDSLARQMGYTQKFKNKGDVLKALRQKIVGKKGAFDRVNA